jgi:hypothetical protein
MTANQPTNLSQTAYDPIVGVSPLAMTARQPTNIYQLHSVYVGAGLLAKASTQPTHHQLTHRIREQARSHKFMQ